MRSLNCLLLCSAFLAIGCESAPNSEAPAPVTSEAPAAESAQPAGSAKAPEITAVVQSWDELQQTIASHKGKVVVVDLWSTWCEPCLREFPNLVALHKKHGSEVMCISVSLDYGGGGDGAEGLRTAIQPMLEKHDATLTNVICSTPSEDVYGLIDLGSVPAVYVYGRDGELKKRFDNDTSEYGADGFTYAAQVVPLVETLLAEKP